MKGIKYTVIEAYEMKKILTGPIRFYQKHISPHTPPTCRFHPTCSTYAIQAIEKHGALKGGIMGTARIIRCNPFVEGGVDEVPDYFTVFRNPDNVDDFHIPEFLMPTDHEAQKRVIELLRKYEDELIVSETLPAAIDSLNQVADVTELSATDIKDRLTEDELSYLEDIEIFPDLASTEYRYYTIEETEKNKRLLKTVEPFFEDTDLGTDFPLVVLEKTGIWYTNVPTLGREFMVQRGVTHQDLKNKSYHLWLVLNTIDEMKIQ